ncbi:MAG: hypothetical protein KC877_04610 [Candidatus Kaiserbacteria bacterium]|nr:hypothetical protein [Candidatus Kaiserbacteria bacterium]MCB9816693.1 hypothetical protein [Candidatus Nomurabacteria bacterium]
MNKIFTTLGVALTVVFILGVLLIVAGVDRDSLANLPTNAELDAARRARLVQVLEQVQPGIVLGLEKIDGTSRWITITRNDTKAQEFHGMQSRKDEAGVEVTITYQELIDDPVEQIIFSETLYELGQGMMMTIKPHAK